MQQPTKLKNTSKRVLKTKKVNQWREHHDTLNDKQKAEAKENITHSCEWSQDTFYRKMRNPQKIKNWEKNLVASGYGVLTTFLFPETATADTY